MSAFVKNFWIHTTCLIRNEKGTGTGFFISDAENKRIFLVSNKHVLNPNGPDKLPEKLAVEFNIDINGKLMRDGLEWEYDNRFFEQHPNDDIDIHLIDFTYGIYQYGVQFNKKIDLKSIPLRYLATSDKLDKYEIKISDEVFIVGYPSTNNLRHGITNLPFVRQGIIASNIGEELEDEVKDSNGQNKTRRMKAFLVDGGIIPGISGSPVVLKPTLFRDIKNQMLADDFPPLLLGIVSEYRGAFMAKHFGETYYSYANLGIAFDADAIKEAIDFYNSKHSPNKFEDDK